MKNLPFLLTLIGFMSISSCNENKLHTTNSAYIIEIIIDNNSQILFEGTQIDLDNFSSMWANRISELNRQNILEEDVIIHLQVHTTANMELISDLQTELKNLDTKKVFYSSL